MKGQTSELKKKKSIFYGNYQSLIANISQDHNIKNENNLFLKKQFCLCRICLCQYRNQCCKRDSPIKATRSNNKITQKKEKKHFHYIYLVHYGW